MGKLVFAISLNKGVLVTSPDGILIILNPDFIALLRLSIEKTDTQGMTEAFKH